MKIANVGYTITYTVDGISYTAPFANLDLVAWAVAELRRDGATDIRVLYPDGHEVDAQ